MVLTKVIETSFLIIKILRFFILDEILEMKKL